MPYATVNSDPHQVRLHYEILVGENAWDEMIARDSLPSQVLSDDGGAPGERVPLSQRWDLVERGGIPVGHEDAAAEQ
jgi:hypothetical protein